MSNFAFGTYRITDHNPQHIAALKEAILMRVPMIDTSSNYMDGAAERAIALAFHGFDETVTNSIEIVSKVGYIQGSNLARHKEKPFDEVVEYSESCYHSIAPSFIKEQLNDSLNRLQRDSIGCYLLHNPEYYLYDSLNKNIDKATRLDEIYRRIYEAFVALEELVAKKKIASYGVSSNSFSLPQSDELFLPYEDLPILAQKAALEAGNSSDSFTTIQLPINLLEQEGLKCAKWAKESGLRVLVNRPLNAQKDALMYRLADYDESQDYYNHLNELLEISETKELEPLFNLVEQLDGSKHKFGWIGDYDAFLVTQIIPLIKKILEQFELEMQEQLIAVIDLFLQEYKQMVAYECSKRTRVALKSELGECFVSLQECALRFLTQSSYIDYILVGMRKPSYVQNILSLED